MPNKQDRSNSYYEALLKSGYPGIHANYISGKYPSLHQALLAAGIKKPRTRLHELKNAWSKASVVERREFLQWVRTQSAAISKPATGRPMAVDRRLEPWAKARVKTIMTKRDVKMGDVMRELGLGSRNPSLGLALARGSRLHPVALAALEKWLLANASV